MPDKSILIDTKTIDGYNLFLKCKKLPRYKIVGSSVITDEKSYQYVFGGKDIRTVKHLKHKIEFDYQSYVIERALQREKFAAFLDCGLGKTIIELVFAHSVINSIGGKGIIYCPLSVLEDIQRECNRLYGYRMSNLRHDEWKTDIAIINYEGMKPVDTKNVTVAVLDESGILKSGDGETCKYLTDSVKNVKFRMACSATPSPNDQTEYASHAVWLGISNTLKEFYSKFFVKDGTEWRMKAHAKDSFYDFLKSWACYIQSPSSLGFEIGAELPEEPNYIIQKTYPVGYHNDGSFLASNIDLVHARKIFGDLRADKTQERFKAAEVAVSLWQAGYAVICPHLNSAHMDGACHDENFLVGGIEIMRRCDMVILLPHWHRSEGTRKEVAQARLDEIPIYEYCDYVQRHAAEFMGCDVLKK
jgi:hypothetical protein